MEMPASASGTASAANTPTSENSTGPCTLKIALPRWLFTLLGTHASSQTMERSSAVRVTQTKPLSGSQAGSGEEGPSRHTAKRSGKNGKLQSASGHRECTPSEKAFYQPPIHGNRSPGDVAGAFRSQKGDQRGELLGASDTAEGSLTAPFGENLFARRTGARRDGSGQLVEALGERVAGQDVVHRDSIRAEFIGERARQARHRSANGVRKERSEE